MPDREDRLLAAFYRTWGKASVYVLDGTSAPCSVVFIRQGDPRRKGPLDPVKFGGTAFTLAESTLDILVRLSEIAQPHAGGVFTLLDAAGNPTGPSFEIGAEPMFNDEEQREWRCPTVAGGA